MATRVRTRTFLQPPPDDYKFNNLIADLRKNITSEEVIEVKDRFKNIVPDNVSTPGEMFDALKEAGVIDCHNILYIQQIISVLAREDLIEIAANYIRLFEEDEILHFFKKTIRLAEGCDIVEFHVVGQNISNRRELETFRRDVSTILLVPLHQVIIKGVQETSSTLITLMLPSIYVEFLKHQLEQNKQYMIESFIRQGVDETLFSRHSFKLKRDGTHFLAEKTEIPIEQNRQMSRNKSKRPVSIPQSQKVIKKRILHVPCALPTAMA